MLQLSDREKIEQLAEKYSVQRILLFGSAVTENEPGDIDLAVDGIRPEFFFKLYGELLSSLSLPVDLIDLAEKNLFSQLVEQEGTLLYAAH